MTRGLTMISTSFSCKQVGCRFWATFSQNSAIKTCLTFTTVISPHNLNCPILEMLRIAHYFNEKSLLDVCVQYAVNQLCVQTVISHLIIAEQLDVADYIEGCMKLCVSCSFSVSLFIVQYFVAAFWITWLQWAFLPIWSCFQWSRPKGFIRGPRWKMSILVEALGSCEWRGQRILTFGKFLLCFIIWDVSLKIYLLFNFFCSMFIFVFSFRLRFTVSILVLFFSFFDFLSEWELWIVVFFES